MRYIVYTESHTPQKFESIGEAAKAAVDDPDGSRMAVFDKQDNRWITGSEIIWAYVNSRKIRHFG
jgi:phosphomannomutase